MQTVLFDARAWCLDLFPKMVNHLEKDTGKKINPVALYHNNLDLKNFGTSTTKENLNDYFETGLTKYSKEDIMHLEKKYGFINLWHAVYFDRFLKNQKEDFIIKQISYYIFAWEEIFKKHKPAYIVNETVTGLWNYIPQAMAKHFNCTYLGYLVTKNTSKYYFTRDIMGSFPEMNRRFEELKKRDLEEGEKKQVEDFTDAFKKKHMVPSYMKITSSLPKIHNFFNPYRITVNIYKDLKLFFAVKNDYKIDFRFNGYQRDFIRLWRVFYIKCFKLFSMPNKSDKYILFPLHYQPEASTDIWAAYHADQYNVIVNLAKSIPFGYKLYVKEHYAVLGSKEIAFYKKIKKLPNVQLIDPWVKISDLINNAAAISVLTGTTGLEGIILKKPVIIFGNVFFDIYPQLYKVKDLEKLPEIIDHALNNFVVDEEMYQKYISAYISSGYEGRVHGNNYSAEEVRLHCDNLISEIQTK